MIKEPCNLIEQELILVNKLKVYVSDKERTLVSLEFN